MEMNWVIKAFYLAELLRKLNLPEKAMQKHLALPGG
jgi:hypothetical protein